MWKIKNVSENNDVYFSGYWMPSAYSAFFPASCFPESEPSNTFSYELDNYLLYWVADPEPTPPTLEEIQQAAANSISNAVRTELNRVANTYRYDTIHTAMLAIGSSNTKYNSEGLAFKQWWTDVWTYIDNLEQEVLQGNIAFETVTVDYVLSNLPGFVAPV